MCHPDREHEGRGLCGSCWQRARLRGELADYPRVLRTRKEFLADYIPLREVGLSTREIAQRMGVTRSAIYVALRRARLAGEWPA